MKTDEVHIVGQGTDLKFNIKGMNAIPCGGEYNIPDGEVFTAPIKDSVNGVLQYNTPTVYNGQSFENIRFVSSTLYAPLVNAGNATLNGMLGGTAVDVYQSVIVGKEAYATVNLSASGSGLTPIVVNP